MQRLSTALFALGWAGAVSAAPLQEAYLGGSLLDFTYKEFDEDDVLLDREDGMLPGAVAGLSITGKKGWYGAINASLHGGEVTYDGQTQSGIPVRTDTLEHIADLALEAGRRFEPKHGPPWAVFAGIGYRWWERDIQSTRLPSGRRVSGVLEVYRWWYGFLGVRATLSQTERSSTEVALSVTHTVAPKIDVKEFGGADPVTLELGEKTGARLALRWRYHWSSAVALEVGSYYEQWDIGRSDMAPLTIDGVRVVNAGGFPISIVEPRSETRNYGVNVIIRRVF